SCTARRPPNRLPSPRSSSAGSRPLGAQLSMPAYLPDRNRAGFGRPPIVTALFAELAWWEIAAVNRLLEELGLAELSKLADIRIGLDHGVPELLLVVAEHLLLLDLFDVDVLHGVASVIENNGSTQRIELHGAQLLDEFRAARPLAVVLFHDLMDHLCRRVVGLRIVGCYLAVFGAVFLHEFLVL